MFSRKMFVAVALFASVFAYGNHANEVVVSNTSGSVTFGGGSTDISLDAGWFSHIADMFQVGGYLNVGHQSAGTTNIMALVGPQLNFPGDNLGEAIFIGVFAGINWNAGASSTDFAFRADLGKRFQIVENVSFRPYVSLSKVGSTPMRFAVVPLSFSIWY